MADEIVRTLDYDHRQLHIDTNLMLNAALRAKKLDEVASRFLARHPDGVGLDLGAGLDTRVLRIDPPSTVDWYDVDTPAVIAARAGLVPDRAHAHGIGADVTDPDWLSAVPPDRPAVIVADGLLGFLTLDQVVALLNRLTSHFPSGEIAFNSYPRFAIWAIKHTHGPRSVSIPTTTCSASASSARWSAIRACSAASPSIPSGSRRRANLRPSSSTSSMS
jgi:O-methyltransferase involved in polyketide biosynthesis